MNRSFFSVFLLRLAVVMVAVGLVCVFASRIWLLDILAIAIGALVAAFWMSGPLDRAVTQLRLYAGETDPNTKQMKPTLYLGINEVAETLADTFTRFDRTFAASAESRQELEAMLDSMQDAVIAVDSAGRIQWTNQSMQRIVPGASFSSSVRIGHALVQTIRDPDVLDCMRRALSERIVVERRSTSIMTGKIFEISAAPTPGGGAVAVLHDITRIEQMERTQREFVANVSHELRTPLTSISGYVETLLDHEKSLSPQAREFLSTILKNATRMNRLTEDLLVMARVESSEQELRPISIPADILVRDAVQAMSGLVQDTSTTLEIGGMTKREVMADPDSILQVLSNLIENAIKYARSKEDNSCHIVVSTRDISEPFEGVEFSVKDFGPGIASEHLDRIFERFYRVDKARSRESGGTGLGLAISRHVIEAQGGSIRAESELGKGSNLIFTLPEAETPV